MTQNSEKNVPGFIPIRDHSRTSRKLPEGPLYFVRPEHIVSLRSFIDFRDGLRTEVGLTHGVHLGTRLTIEEISDLMLKAAR